MTKANEFDKINELLIERTAKKFERASKNKLKKFLTNEKFCDKINELIRVGAAKILANYTVPHILDSSDPVIHNDRHIL